MTQPTWQPERDDKGRFKPGFTPCPTRKEALIASQKANRILWDTVDGDVFHEVLQKHLQLIRNDKHPATQLRAIELLYNRMFGLPKQHLEVDATTEYKPTFNARELTDEQLTTVLDILAPIAVQPPMLPGH